MGFNTSLLLLFTAYVSAHTVITYPGWRGNNLKTNTDFPYGMQSIYPCGGIGTTKNRTYWPTTGGAVAFQPGWIQGDKTTFAYVNLGFGTDGPDGGPPNMSNPMIKPFRIQAPSDNPYPGTICLPQVPLPVGASVKVGDKATIQLVELAPHGSSLYSCVDIIFAEPGDSKIAQVNETNCFNSTQLSLADMYTITYKASGSNEVVSSSVASSLSFATWAGILPLLIMGLWTIA